MKKRTLNFSLPATMSDFVTDENDTRYSRGKLNIFYKGETPDHRLFNDEFSEALLPTAAYAPVVGYYDREKGDFVGHATEQAIYGIVDPVSEPEFKTMDDGNVWATCDVVLYTERPGEVGEIAKKIVGHSQSLELNPSTVEYKINYDEKKHFKNLEFTKGEIIGVSVLGNDQKPAFTGSGFFSTSDFEEKMKLLREYCEKPLDNENNEEKDGGQMISDFMELSWRDISEKVASAIEQAYGEDGYPMLMDAFNDHVVFVIYYYMGGKKYLDIQYSCTEDGEVTLGDVVEVRPTYVPIEQAETSQMENQASENPQNQGSSENPTGEFTNPDGQTEPTVDNEVQTPTPEQPIGDPTQAQAQLEPVGNADSTPADGNQEQTPDSQNPDSSSASVNENENKQEDPSASTFTNSEQEELKNNQRKQKVDLINEYRKGLSDEQFADFVSRIDEYEFSDLAVELLKIQKNSQSTVFRGFSNPMISNNPTSTKDDDLGHIVAKVLNK